MTRRRNWSALLLFGLLSFGILVAIAPMISDGVKEGYFSSVSFNKKTGHWSNTVGQLLPVRFNNVQDE
ncbi:MAG: hypothetical protein AAFU78_21485 [Cyanobacteria bacterium J06633_2]